MSSSQLPDLDESGIYVYETADVDETVPAPPSAVEVVSDRIDVSEIPRDQALETFVTSTELSYGNSLEGRIAYISQQIEQLRDESTDSRVDDLASALERVSVSKRKPRLGVSTAAPIGEKPVSMHTTYTPEQLARFAELDRRLSAVESNIGHTQTPAPVLSIVASLKQKLDLLSSAPTQFDHAIKNLEALSQVVDKFPGADHVGVLYEQVETLGPALDAIPALFLRLRSLQLLHAEASGYQAAVNDIDTTLSLMKSDIAKWNERLDTLESKLLDKST